MNNAAQTPTGSPARCSKGLVVGLVIGVLALAAVAALFVVKSRRKPVAIPAVRVETPAPVAAGTPAAVPAAAPVVAPVTAASAGEPLRVGGRYSGVVEDVGKQGDGIVKVQGKVVFVTGGRKGDRVEFEVTENLDRFARGRVVGMAAAAAPAAAAAADAPPVDGATATAEEVQPGRVFDVMISEADRRAPDRDGVAKIGGLVVFVSNARPDERVRIRVVQRMTRFARAEVIARPDAAASEAAP
ncbi:MAG TPA: TRAM domain-containing protein [Kiritimatiellia bacterium]|nr:TRAM domain-containing protein [Kiritimatiellia bacterium]HRZ11270.1 TRAM domain-containing protein [Kiritimatiellia bacterium]HSA19121.1 TRAM domain-containing protein [Kiritimatiellia bacterium]